MRLPRSVLELRWLPVGIDRGGLIELRRSARALAQQTEDVSGANCLIGVGVLRDDRLERVDVGLSPVDLPGDRRVEERESRDERVVLPELLRRLREPRAGGGGVPVGEELVGLIVEVHQGTLGTAGLVEEVGIVERSGELALGELAVQAIARRRGRCRLPEVVLRERK